MSDEKKVTLNVKFEINEKVMLAIMAFFGMTMNRVRQMMCLELKRNGMSSDATFFVGQSDNSLAYTVCNSFAEIKEMANIYEQHEVINLHDGKRFTFKASHKRGVRSVLVPIDEEISEEK